nr:hypothetical protein [Ralstonia pseudosolanacearum]
MVEHIGDAQQHAVEAVAVLHQPADAQADPPRISAAIRNTPITAIDLAR